MSSSQSRGNIPEGTSASRETAEERRAEGRVGRVLLVQERIQGHGTETTLGRALAV